MARPVHTVRTGAIGAGVGRSRAGDDGGAMVSDLCADEIDGLATLVRYLRNLLTPARSREDRSAWSNTSPYDRATSAALVQALAAKLPVHVDRDLLPPRLPAKYGGARIATPFVALRPAARGGNDAARDVSSEPLPYVELRRALPSAGAGDDGRQGSSADV